MTFDIEIVIRERDGAIMDRIHTHRAPTDWTDDDVAGVLRDMLAAVDRARDPQATDRHVALRGFSWIVEPTTGGVVIAMEMTTGAAVAGPFAVGQAQLDAMVRRVMTAAQPRPQTVH